MILSTSQKIFIVIALVFLFGFILFSSFTGDKTVEEDVVVEKTTAVNGEEILILLEKSRSVSIDESIFISPLFIALDDWGIKLTPEPQGRPNPFAPIGFDIFTTTLENQNQSTSTVR